VLVSQPSANYPPGPLAEGRGASVLLLLDVGEDGTVVGASVVEPAGEGFDEAALGAAAGFRFEPARMPDGAPVAARIQYRYVFVASRAAPRVVEGILTDAVTGLPFPDIELRASRPDRPDVPPVPARTNADGAFAWSGLEPGVWTITGVVPAHLAIVVQVEVKEGVVAQLAVRAEPDQRGPASATVVVEGERRSPDITERTLSQEEVRYLPGTGGDVVKVVQNLPGVARAPLGVGQLIIRGTAPEDSAYFLDGAPIPIVFHFSGLSTVLNGDFVAEVAYLPGNYGVRYGRALGGLVDLRTKDTIPERSDGYVALDLFQGTAWVEQKLSDRTAVQLSVRRSWVDAVLTPILSSGASTVRAPQYWDAQARVLHQLKGGGSVDVLGLFSDDRFKVVGDEDGAIAIGLNTTFGRGRVRWLQPLGEWENELTVSAGPDSQVFAFDGNPEAAFERSLRVSVREEVSHEGGPGDVGLRAGLDLVAGRDAFQYEGFGTSERGDAWRAQPALYAEPQFTFGGLRVFPGVRADLLATDAGQLALTVDPRLGSRFVVGPTTTLKASVGRYSQFAGARQLTPASEEDPDADGTDGLRPSWSLQSSLGVEQALPMSFTLEGTVFYNRLYDLVVGREDRLRFFTGPPSQGPFDSEPYANEGSGRVCGAEVLLRLDLPRTVGLLSATFSNANRVDREGEQSLYTYDQPFVVNALASQELPKGWRVGGRFRTSAGYPYTPVVNRVYDLESRSFLPVYGEADSARLPVFWSVDLRIDKAWQFKHWELTWYLDLQNAFNTQNPEVMAWSWDYAKEEPINGLPILPAFGLRGEW